MHTVTEHHIINSYWPDQICSLCLRAFCVCGNVTRATEEWRGYKKNVHAYTKTWSSRFDMINKYICLQRDATMFEDEHYGFYARMKCMLYMYTLMGVTTIYFGGGRVPMLEKYQSVPPNNRPIIL